ncbi:hypothetical protein CLAIMM_00310 isoform 2 [Cladophialophora immunda]|nr:hypothetical protein CLAIMM_00310 isoform 2 [Cladophialophora immunda]
MPGFHIDAISLEIILWKSTWNRPQVRAHNTNHSSLSTLDPACGFASLGLSESNSYSSASHHASLPGQCGQPPPSLRCLTHRSFHSATIAPFGRLPTFGIDFPLPFFRHVLNRRVSEHEISLEAVGGLSRIVH